MVEDVIGFCVHGSITHSQTTISRKTAETNSHFWRTRQRVSEISPLGNEFFFQSSPSGKMTSDRPALRPSPSAPTEAKGHQAGRRVVEKPSI